MEPRSVDSNGSSKPQRKPLPTDTSRVAAARAAARAEARAEARRAARAAAAARAKIPCSAPAQHLKRPGTDTACIRCREQKIPCDDVRPLQCSRCIERGLQCEWPEVKSTKLTERNDVDTEEERSRICEDLFRVLQTKSGGESLELFRRLTNGEDPLSLVHYIKDDLLSQNLLVPQTWYRYSFPYGREMPSFLVQHSNPYLDSLIYQGVMNPPETQQRLENRKDLSDYGAQYHVPYHAAELVEPLIDMAKPSRWTQVTATDDVLRTLLKAYFLYVYPTLPLFHKDFFLQDMTTGRNEFCSSLLVNAVLAAACHACNRVPNRAEYWHPYTLQYGFSAEARRLTDFELCTDSLTTIQAMLIMSTTYNTNAVDYVGWSYQLEALAMADRMKLFELPSPSGEKMRVARTFTAWAVFCYQASFCFHFFRPPLLREPPRDVLPDPEVLPNWYPETCVLYPLNNDPIRIHHADVFKATAEFRVIMNDISASAFPHPKTQNKLSLQQTLSLYSRLKQWYQNLPLSLSIKQAVLPSQLFVHLHYFNIVLCLFDPFTDTERPGGGAVNQPGEEIPEAIVLESRIGLETVWRLYYLRHGFELYDPSLIQTHALLGFMSSRALSQSSELTPHHSQLLQSTVVLAGKGLHDHAKNSYLGEAILCVFKDTLDAENTRLLKDYADISETHDKEKKSLIAERVLSQYPISTVSIAENPDSYRLDNMLAAYKYMSLSDEEQGHEIADEAEDSKHELASEEPSMSGP